MIEITTTPDGRTIPEPIKHDAPKHRCPICNHVCHPTRRNKDREALDVRNGRPPEVTRAIFEYIQKHGSVTQPVTSVEIGKEYGYSPATIHQYIYRARVAGWPIKSAKRHGYYVAL